ncbi:MAG: type II secretion system F family protein [Limnochordia bacterium]
MTGCAGTCGFAEVNAVIPILIAALVFWAVFLICFAAADKLRKKLLVENRIRVFIPGPGIDEGDGDDQDKVHVLQRLLGWLTRKLKLKPSRRLALELMRADIPLSAGEFLVLNVMLGLLPLFLVLFGYSVEFCLLLALGALLAPSAVVKLRQKKRMHLIETQLPEVLGIIANSLKAGYSFFQAIELVSRESKPPLASEFALVNKEMNLGATTELALENMVERVGSDDLDLVVTAVLIQRQVGGNLSAILESIAETIRERIRIRGEIRSLTAQGRISGLIISVLPFLIAGFIFVVHPEYIMPLFVEPLGRIMLGMGIGGQFLAVLMIKKITNIRV